jgi:hypothetical protein
MSSFTDHQAVARQVRSDKRATAVTVGGVLALLGALAYAALRGFGA